MEVLFKNQYTQTEAWIRETVLLAIIKNPGCMISIVISAISFVFAAYELLCYQFINLFLVINFCLFVSIPVVFYFSVVRLQKRRIEEVYGKNSQVFVVVSDTGIEWNVNGSMLHLDFSSVKRAYKSPNYIYLRSKARILYTFRRNGFLAGDEEAFLEFLKEKGIKV